MISIKKNKIQKPNILNNEWISEKLKAIKDTGNPGKKIDSRYKDDEVRNALKKLYHNKCAYCEGKVKPAQNQPNIDHYRPKDKIKSVENHKGYYWLGYEWTNLLHTCTNCNIIKSNQFPLKDESKRISDDLEKEGFFNNGEFVFENFKRRRSVCCLILKLTKLKNIFIFFRMVKLNI